MNNLREAWQEMADWRGGLFTATPGPSLPDKDAEAPKSRCVIVWKDGVAKYRLAPAPPTWAVLICR